MNCTTSHFGGMHFLWWFFWGIILVWIFALPYDIPGQRRSKNAALEILKQRFANGMIEKEEYLEKKEILEGKNN